MEQELIKKIIASVLSKMSIYNLLKENIKPIPIGVSNRHVHLSNADIEVLFGPGYEIRSQKKLSQPGQYAAIETVILAGPKGCIEQVRILGPARKQTQVEISRGDSYKLGIEAPTRESGNLKGSCGITIIGPKGTIMLTEGVITANRHIHLTPQDAAFYGVFNGQSVKVKAGEGRGLVFDNVVVRVSDNFVLEYHIDMDEANAAGIKNGDSAYLLAPTQNKHSQPASENEIKHDIKPAEELQNPLGLITDGIVREAWKRNIGLVVSKDTLYTPLAKDTIKELKVEIVPYTSNQE